VIRPSKRVHETAFLHRHVLRHRVRLVKDRVLEDNLVLIWERID